MNLQFADWDSYVVPTDAGRAGHDSHNNYNNKAICD